MAELVTRAAPVHAHDENPSIDLGNECLLVPWHGADAGNAASPAPSGNARIQEDSGGHPCSDRVSHEHYSLIVVAVLFRRRQLPLALFFVLLVLSFMLIVVATLALGRARFLRVFGLGREQQEAEGCVDVLQVRWVQFSYSIGFVTSDHEESGLAVVRR